MREIRQVHPSYVETPGPEWCVADGGRCYKVPEVMASLREYVMCPRCPGQRWFKNLDAYRAHWDACHAEAPLHV